MTSKISVAEIKRHFSDVLTRIERNHDHFVVERRGRPVAAMIGVDELDRLDVSPSTSDQGVLALAGIAENLEGIDEMTTEIYRQRHAAQDRPVPDLDH